MMNKKSHDSLDKLIRKTIVNGYITKYNYIDLDSYKTTTMIESIENNEDKISYEYDIDGVSGLEYEGKKYYYIKDIQGDIIGIVDEESNKVVSYEYDS